jgi:CHAT domain-containing protein
MLLMSRTSEESAIDNLLPADIRGLDFSASLVVLSRTTVSSLSQSGFDSRLGFVSDFLRNGASNVVVSLRSRNDSETAGFMADFYKELESSQNVAEALSRSKIKSMKSADPGNFMSWAGFQLYIR